MSLAHLANVNTGWLFVRPVQRVDSWAHIPFAVRQDDPCDDLGNLHHAQALWRQGEAGRLCWHALRMCRVFAMPPAVGWVADELSGGWRSKSWLGSGVIQAGGGMLAR